MLKIITTVQKNSGFRVQLYGQFTGEYVSELEKALARSAGNGKVALDLANVTFVDRAAMKFLRDVKAKNVAVENMPSYVARWIEQEVRRGVAPAESS
jgi:anti-anti-sigma regulatory factor